jgi:hypothetical protein
METSMAEEDSAGVDSLDDEDEVLASILAESRDSYLKEQYSILQSIQELSVTVGDEHQATASDTWNDAVDFQNHDYDDAAWNRRHQYRSVSSSYCDLDRIRGNDRKMPCKKDSRSEMSSHDPWCSTSTMNTSPTTATEFSDDDVIQEQMRILQEIQANSGRHLPLRDHDSQHEQNASDCCTIPPAAKASKNEKQESSPFEDQTLHLCDGSQVRVRGMKQVFTSISQGDAILTECVVCGTISQVPAQARALFCTVCREISPVVPMEDAELARSIQRIEKELQNKS